MRGDPQRLTLTENGIARSSLAPNPLCLTSPASGSFSIVSTLAGFCGRQRSRFLVPGAVGCATQNHEFNLSLQWERTAGGAMHIHGRVTSGDANPGVRTWDVPPCICTWRYEHSHDRPASSFASSWGGRGFPRASTSELPAAVSVPIAAGMSAKALPVARWLKTEHETGGHVRSDELGMWTLRTTPKPPQSGRAVLSQSYRLLANNVRLFACSATAESATQFAGSCFFFPSSFSILGSTHDLFAIDTLGST